MKPETIKSFSDRLFNGIISLTDKELNQQMYKTAFYQGWEDFQAGKEKYPDCMREIFKGDPYARFFYECPFLYSKRDKGSTYFDLAGMVRLLNVMIVQIGILK